MQLYSIWNKNYNHLIRKYWILWIFKLSSKFLCLNAYELTNIFYVDAFQTTCILRKSISRLWIADSSLFCCVLGNLLTDVSFVYTWKHKHDVKQCKLVIFMYVVWICYVSIICNCYDTTQWSHLPPDASAVLAWGCDTTIGPQPNIHINTYKTCKSH